MNDGHLFHFRTALWQVAALALCSPLLAAPADDPPDFVPLGAYLSWERPSACAGYYGIDRWVDVCNRLNALEANHINLLWVANMSEADLPRLIEECGKRDIKLLPSLSTFEAKIDWRWVKDGAYYHKVLPRAVEVAGKSDTLVGWVLSDEPKVEHFPRLETLRLRLRELDPSRFCTSVTMWPQTPEVPKQTKLPVVCVDLYPFFGPNDPNGPHTDAASRSFFRKNAAKMIDAIGDRNTVGWVMGMCFSDIWGPRKYDEQGHLVGLPGSYLHWRCPTLAEMRWQVWETFRSGAKGFVCYTLAPEVPDPKKENLPPPDVKWKDVLARKSTDMGPNALTNPDGSTTPQLEELGRAFAKIAPHAELIRRWRHTKEPLLETEGAGKTQTFRDAETGKVFAVVLNDDLHQGRTIIIRVGEKTSFLTDVIQNQEISLERGLTEGTATGKISLKAGDGTILAIGQGR
jgi:hypothetical protein